VILSEIAVDILLPTDAYTELLVCCCCNWDFYLVSI